MTLFLFCNHRRRNVSISRPVKSVTHFGKCLLFHIVFKQLLSCRLRFQVCGSFSDYPPVGLHSAITLSHVSWVELSGLSEENLNAWLLFDGTTIKSSGIIYAAVLPIWEKAPSRMSADPMWVSWNMKPICNGGTMWWCSFYKDTFGFGFVKLRFCS